jgi:hypothetical protein
MLPNRKHTVVRQGGSKRAKTPQTQRRELSAERDCSSTERGLCMNCDVRDTCTFTKPEGGVWFCEEYQ